jgi:hypothetical protein
MHTFPKPCSSDLKHLCFIARIFLKPKIITKRKIRIDFHRFKTFISNQIHVNIQIGICEFLGIDSVKVDKLEFENEN